MTIDESINQIIDSLMGKKANLLNYSDRIALTDALNTMHKYQKIQDKLDQLEHEMECVLESDTRTMINRESENGWLFDKIIRWRKIISEVEE